MWYARRSAAGWGEGTALIPLLDLLQHSGAGASVGYAYETSAEGRTLLIARAKGACAAGTELCLDYGARAF